MREQDRVKIKKILGEMQCPKDFTCVASGMRVLCAAEDVGTTSFLRCLEEEPSDCVFAAHYRGRWYCKCPLRVYLSKNLKL